MYTSNTHSIKTVFNYQVPLTASCISSYDYSTIDNRILTNFIRENITVWMHSYFSGLDSTKQVKLLLVKQKQNSLPNPS